MRTGLTIAVVTAMMWGIPLLAGAEPQDENLKSNPASGTRFATTSACTERAPCQNITGEILRIEETYLIRETNGRESSMKVTRASHMEALPNVGDSIAAQLSSNGEVQSLTKLSKVRERQDIVVPSNTQGELR
jgi:hypothetical protein